MRKFSQCFIVAVVALATTSILAASTANASTTTPRTHSFGHSTVTPMNRIAIAHSGDTRTGAYSYRRSMTSGSWSSQASEPVLYNYGLISWGSVIDPPSNIPSAAVITDICWTWNYTYPHPSAGIWMYLTGSANPDYAILSTSGNELGCSTLDNGQPADQEFEFGFASPTSTSGYYPPILPPAAPGGPSTISVSYSG
jgi:hypothetical protein